MPEGGGGAWPNNKPTHRATSATWHHWCGGHRRVRRAWLQCSWAAEGPGWASSRRTSTRQHTNPHWCGGHRRVRRAWLRHPRAVAGLGRASRRRAKPHISDQASLVWRAPEGPEGTGGLRGAAPNEVRMPSLAGGRALRRPKHQRGNKHQHAARTASGRAAAHRHRPHKATHSTGARTRRPAPLDATTQTQLRSTCVRYRSARAARRSRRSSRSPRLRRRAGPRR